VVTWSSSSVRTVVFTMTGVEVISTEAEVEVTSMEVAEGSAVGI